MQLKSHIPEFVELVCKRLNDAGFQAFIVGGAVRDIFLQKPFSDWDLATDALPEEIKRVFPDIRHFSLKHDTVTLIDSGHNFEVTTFRGKKATIFEDLARRDFTINAMAYDLKKRGIIDPYGGTQDIAGKIIRAVGNPRERFQEDSLRLLRAVRLATELGFRIEPDTKYTIEKMATKIQAISPERIRNEIIKLLLSYKPSKGFYLMVSTGLLKYLIPELLEGYLKRQNNYHKHTIFRHIMETADIVEPVPLLRLTALFHDIGKPRTRTKSHGKWIFYGHEEISAVMAEEIMYRLKFSRDIIKNVKNLITHHMINYNSEWSDSAIRRLIRRAGRENIINLMKFRRSDILAHGLHHPEGYLIEELESRIKDQLHPEIPLEPKDLAIDGNKIMEILGLSPGPDIGRILNKLVDIITDHPEMNNKNKLVTIIKKIHPLMTLPTM
ncbi:MAG TPA: HD domain-containing protein [Desulfobacteraceae bacterium]|nr:HD domain-containing protein [Desulfobacteraceae bacterium]